jgi:hypothetical protein
MRVVSFRFILVIATILSLCASAYAVDPTKFYFWVAGATEGDYVAAKSLQAEGYVVEVDAQIADQIRSKFSAGYGHVGVSGHVAPGSVDYNRNYSLPGHPAWNWHFTVVDNVYVLPGAIVQCECGLYISAPSDIAVDPQGWISRNGDYYFPRYYEVKGEVHPSNADALANVSNRGVSGTGEKTLIAGLIITGGEPRNVIVRALGPSLSAQGIQQPASNPRIDVYDGVGRRIGTNTDWKTDARAAALSASYPALAPPSDQEAALWLTLLPGNYTLQGTNEDGTEGVMLLEAYDVDRAAP